MSGSEHVYEELWDTDLVKLIGSNNEQAFAEMFRRYNAPLYSHALHRLQDRDAARDLVQEVFVGFWEKRAAIEISSNLSGYLYKTLQNQIFNFIRHSKVIAKYTESLLGRNEANEVFADHLIREKQFSAMIAREIAALPPRMREVFELKRMENLSTREVAERLGIKELTVTDQMKKAMRILRLRIGLMVILASLIDKNL